MAPDLATGRLDYVVNAIPPLETLIKAGKLKVLAVTTASRLPGWESVETVAEILPGFVLAGFVVLAVPSGTPLEIRERVNQEAKAIVGNPSFLERSASYGWYNRQPSRSLQETVAYVRSERERWDKIIEGLGIQPK